MIFPTRFFKNQVQINRGYGHKLCAYVKLSIFNHNFLVITYHLYLTPFKDFVQFRQISHHIKGTVISALFWGFQIFLDCWKNRMFHDFFPPCFCLVIFMFDLMLMNIVGRITYLKKIKVFMIFDKARFMVKRIRPKFPNVSVHHIFCIY